MMKEDLHQIYYSTYIIIYIITNPAQSPTALLYHHFSICQDVC